LFQLKKNKANYFYFQKKNFFLGAGAADSLSNAYAAATLPQFSSAAFTTSPLSNPALAQAVAAAAGKQIEGTLA
jgi:hypothetical protein